jgi:HK97 family phage major capsid protein
LIGGIVQQAITGSESGFVKADTLKEIVREEMKPLIQEETQALQKSFEAEVEKLSKLPGEGGANDIDPDDKNKNVGLAKNGGYDCIADFAKDVFLAGQQGAEPSPRFGKWMADVKAYNTAMKAAGSPTLEVGDPELGGFLTPEEFSKNILDKGFENSNFIDRTTKVPMAINQIGIPFQKDFDHSSYLHGAMMAYWLDEKAEKTATNPKFGKITLRLNKLVVLVYATDELLEDSVISMEPLLKGKASDVIGWKIDQALFAGDGVGKPKGILNAKCKVAQAAEGGQSADTIVYKNIVKMYARMYPQCLKNAIWVANSNTFPQLAQMGLEVGTAGGSAAYLPANGLSGKPYDTLMGKPIVWTEHAKTLGDEGDIVFVDWSQYLTGLKRGAGAGVQFASSIHLKFDYDQTAFRFVMRIDGQPWWPAAFTPSNGDTLSPIVTLAAR